MSSSMEVGNPPTVQKPIVPPRPNRIVSWTLTTRNAMRFR
jgi:hypothetical protein